MKTIAVVVGIGGNNLEIPCLFFETEKDAEEFLISLFGEAYSKAEKKVHLEEVRNENGYWDSAKGYTLGSYVAGEGWKKLYEHPDEVKWDNFFTRYYGGCGGCYALQIREVEFGKPFIGWDLD